MKSHEDKISSKISKTILTYGFAQFHGVTVIYVIPFGSMDKERSFYKTLHEMVPFEKKA